MPPTYMFLKLRPNLIVSLSPQGFFLTNLVSVAAAIFFAVDLLAPATDPSTLGVPVPALIPAWFFAVLILLGALLIMVGSLRPPRLPLMMTGHLMLGASFIAVGVGVIYGRVTDGLPGGIGAGIALLLSLGVINVIFAAAVQKKIQATAQLIAEEKDNG